MRPWLAPLVLVIPLGGAVLAAALKERAAVWAALASSVATLAAGSLALAEVLSGGPLIHRVGGYAPPYGIVLVIDTFSASLVVLTSLLFVASILHLIVPGEKISQTRLHVALLVLVLFGLNGMFVTGDLFNLYVFVELVVLASFVLVATADRSYSPEATFKYTMLSTIGSLAILVGVSMVYSGMGTLNMADLAGRVARDGLPPVVDVAASLLLFGFLLKAAIFPFHFWQPDAHSAATSNVSAILSGIQVKLGIYGIVRMGTLLFPQAAALSLVAPIGAAAAAFGALAALANNDLKRTLAYSTISNMGLILLAFGWGGAGGLAAGTIYLIHHSLTKASLFLSGGHLVERAGERSIKRLGGVAGMSTSVTVAFGLGALSIAGIPPLTGYVAKLILFQAGLAAADPVLLTVAAFSSALGIAYATRMFVLVFWGAGSEEVRARWAAHKGFGLPAAALGLAGVYLVLGLWATPLVDLGRTVALELGQPQAYIANVLGGAR
ncbi:MAG: hypothetical protein C4521_02055 [Actinobacteria bacterium]|nr:MAG: hypothetical protein C4521_02055 [Actinomycetota bacterium]